MSAEKTLRCCRISSDWESSLIDIRKKDGFPRLARQGWAKWYGDHQQEPSYDKKTIHPRMCPAVPDMLAAVTAVNRQIASLARVLNSPTVVDGVVVESTNPKTPVHAIVKQRDEATYVFQRPGQIPQPTTRS